MADKDIASLPNLADIADDALFVLQCQGEAYNLTGAQLKAYAAAAAMRKGPCIGANGNWMVWDADKAQYVDSGVYSGGVAPYIGSNGHWFVGDVDSGVSATGPKGSTGTRGSLIYFGTAITGTSTTATVFSSSGVTSARANDLYLNTSTYNLYQCTTSGTASVAKWKYIGCIKGAKGNPGAAGVSPTVAVEGIDGGHRVTITTAEGSEAFDVMDGEDGGADLSALAWLPTIDYVDTDFGDLLTEIDISTVNGYMSSNLANLSYEDLNGVSEISLNMMRQGDAYSPAGSEYGAVTFPVTHLDGSYYIGNKHLANSSYEDTGEAFMISVSSNGFTVIRTTEEGYGTYSIWGSYPKPSWNQMPDEFLSDKAQANLNPSSITVEGAAVSATVGNIVSAVETGKTVFWKNTDDNGTYRVLDVYKDYDGWHRVLLARAKSYGQETGLYYLYYNSNYLNEETGSYLRLVPIYAPGVGVRFIHGLGAAATEKLLNVNSSGQVVVTDVATGETSTLSGLIKGTDYWTEADKAEIVAAVLENFTDVSEEGM